MNCQLKQAACLWARRGLARMRFTPTTRDDGPHDGGPGCDVDRANVVGVVSKPAAGADELGLRTPRRLVYTPAPGARSARVSRIHGEQGDPSEGGLVRDEGAKLSERPSVQVLSLGLPNRYPIADVHQVLDGNPARGVFSLGDELLADDVVGVGVEAHLAPTKTLQVPLGAPTAARLKGGAQLPDAGANGKRLGTAVLFPVGVDGEVADSEVDTEPTLGVDRGAVRNFDGHEQKQLAVSIDEVGLAANADKSPSVVGADSARDQHATVEGQQTHPVKSNPETVESLVVGNGTMRLETGELGPIPLVDLADFGDETDGVLRRKPEPLTDLVVVQFLQAQLVGCVQRKGPRSKPVTSLVDALHGGDQSRLLPGINEQLDGCHEFHVLSMGTPKHVVKSGGWDRIPLSPKGDSLLRRI